VKLTFVVLVVSHYVHDILAKNYNFCRHIWGSINVPVIIIIIIFEFVKVMPKSIGSFFLDVVYLLLTNYKTVIEV